MNPTPWTLTQVPVTSSPTNSKSDTQGNSTPSDTTIGGDPDARGTRSIPTGLTLIGQTSEIMTKQSLGQNELPHGISNGRTSNEGSSITAEGSGNPWATSWPQNGETQSPVLPVRSVTQSWPESSQIATGSYTGQQRETRYGN